MAYDQSKLPDPELGYLSDYMQTRGFAAVVTCRLGKSQPSRDKMADNLPQQAKVMHTA